MNPSNTNRMTMKLFKCPSCLKKFRNLVEITKINCECPICGYENSNEITNNEVNKSNTQNSNNKQNISDTIGNISSKSKNSDINYKKNEQKNILFDIQSQNINNSNNSLVLIMGEKIRNNNNNESRTTANDEMLDTVSENIISNIMESSSHPVIINRYPFQCDDNNTSSQNIIKKLKHFKMEKKYYIKNEQENKFELIKCPICLMEIIDGMDTIILPCEHFYHEKCIDQWLKKHNSCPLCRFDLSKFNYEEQKDYNFNDDCKINMFEDVE